VSSTTVASNDSVVADVVASVIAPAAAEVDRSGAFPVAGIEALARAGALGLLSAAELGGAGGNLRSAAETIEQLAGACGSTAMVVLMHCAGVSAIEAHGPGAVRESIGAGQHLTTLAFSEAGSRSHFWAPLGTATAVDRHVRLDARKSWVTAAGHADSYVWSSRPMDSSGPMTLWLVPTRTQGFETGGGFDGLGLRGNDSTPVAADGVRLDPAAMLGADGAGLDIALSAVLPAFVILSAAFSVGVMEAVVAESARHLNATRLEHLDRTLAQQQTVRLDFARMRLETDRAWALLLDTLGAIEAQRAGAMLRVLESPMRAAGDLAGRVVGVGAVDSPQTTLLPLAHLHAAGVDPESDVTVRRFDIGVGLHGDHIGGERAAARALQADQVDAACMIDGYHLLFTRDGTLPSGSTRVLAQTAPFDHCNMTVGPAATPAQVSRDLLLGMSYADAELRPLLDLEGLKRWCDGLLEGYQPLETAVGHGFESADTDTVLVRGSVEHDRWRDAERAGGVSAAEVVDRPGATWGLAARGALVEAGTPPLHFDIEDRDLVWADIAPCLYAHATASRWDPASAVDWDAAFDLPPIEAAVVQVMTYLVENEQVALIVPARFLGRIHQHFREVLQVLAVQAADEACHMEVFARRATLRGASLGVSGAGGRASLATLLEESDFALASFLLSVLGEGTFLNLLGFLEEHAPDPVTRRVTHLAR
jgi:isovaleryl-CoA dehydrogenase